MKILTRYLESTEVLDYYGFASRGYLGKTLFSVKCVVLSIKY